MKISYIAPVALLSAVEEDDIIRTSKVPEIGDEGEGDGTNWPA